METVENNFSLDDTRRYFYHILFIIEQNAGADYGKQTAAITLFYGISDTGRK